MKAAKIIAWSLVSMAIVLLLFFSLLLTHNAMLYFTHGGEYGILPEKIAAKKDLIWNISFYIHLPSGVFCLLAPFILFSKRYLKNDLNLHRVIGKLYVWITLVTVCPTGMYLALYAKGGFVTQAGFLLQGILLGLFTYQGYRAIMHGNRRAHIHFMMRSYAVAAVVLSFRMLHIVFFLWQVPYQDNYAISQWLGLAVNLLIAEVLITYFNHKTKSIYQLNSQRYATI